MRMRVASPFPRNIPHPEWTVFQRRRVAASLEKQLARFLKERRGDLTYAQFSRKLGFPPSTLHRLEQGAQSITLRGLQQILRKLKCGLHDVFPEE